MWINLSHELFSIKKWLSTYMVIVVQQKYSIIIQVLETMFLFDSFWISLEPTPVWTSAFWQLHMQVAPPAGALAPDDYVKSFSLNYIISLMDMSSNVHDCSASLIFIGKALLLFICFDLFVHWAPYSLELDVAPFKFSSKTYVYSDVGVVLVNLLFVVASDIVAC